MKWLKISAAVVAALVALLAAASFFITLDDYIPELEKELSEWMEEPVSIERLDASLLPTPHARVDGISIGKSKEVTVDKLTIRPDLASLFSKHKVIRSLEFEDVTLAHKALAALISLAQRDDSDASTVRIERVQLRNATLQLEGGSVGPFDGIVEPAENGQRGHVALATRDDALQLRLTPDGERHMIELAAQSWTPPLGPPLTFEQLRIKGTATRAAAELHEVDAKLYGGTASGKVTVTWVKGISLKGSFDVNRVELKQAAALVSRRGRISGRLDAKPVLTAQATTAAELANALRVETPFVVHAGVLHGFDLANAAVALLGQRSAGGSTRFDELAGRLVAERGAYRFTRLRMASGALTARGHVTISPSKALSGELNVSARGTGITAIPLTVAGTLESPTFQPNAGALIGAAAGTAVLGPGVGTAAGVKLGDIAERLLGKKR